MSNRQGEIISLIIGAVLGAILGLFLTTQWEDYKNASVRQQILGQLEREVEENKSIMKKWLPQEIKSVASFVEAVEPLKNSVMIYALPWWISTYPEDVDTLNALQRWNNDILTINYSIQQIISKSREAKPSFLGIPVIQIEVFLPAFFSMLKKLTIKEDIQKVEEILEKEKKTKWQILLKLVPWY